MTTIRRYILNDNDSSPIPDIDVILINKQGKRVGTIATSDENGLVEFPSTEFDGTGQTVEISGAGFEPQISDPALWGSGSLFMVPTSGGTLGDVVVKAVRKKLPVTKQKYALPIVLGSLALVSLSVFAIKSFK